MNKLTKEINSPEFSDYKSIIDSTCASYNKKFNIGELDDIKSQGYLIFIEAKERWDPKKANFNTYLHHCLKHYLIKYITREYIRPRKLLNGIDAKYNYLFSINDYITNPLSIEIIETILNRPESLQDNTKYKTCITMNKVRKGFQKKGYKIHDINKAIKHIQNGLCYE